MQATKKYISLILVVWLAYLLILYLSQKFHLGFGYHIWPQGEDRNWLSFLKDCKNAGMVKAFWKVDGRNPLSAWYWYYASPIILNSNWGLYFLSLLVSPIFSIITFLLLDKFGRKQFSVYAISVALVVLVWNFSSRFDHSPLISYIALSQTMLSLFFYCTFIDDERKNSHYILLSLIFYFLAFTTYTLQSGALIGIILIGLFRAKDTLKNKIINTFTDASFFFMLFYLYNLIWYETTPVSSHYFFCFRLQKIISFFAESIHKLILPPSIQYFINLIISDWSFKKICGIFTAGLISFLAIFFNPYSRKLREGNFNVPYMWSLVILVSIALPTIIAESMGSIFVPGDRSYFFQQIFQPILCIACIFSIVNMFIKHEQIKRILILFCVSALAALTLLINFYYNYRLLNRTHYQMKLAKLLNNLTIPSDSNISFLIKVNKDGNQDIGSEPFFLPSYAKTVLNIKNASIRILSNSDPLLENNKLVFNNENVLNANNFSDHKKFSYNNVLIVSFDGKKLEVPKKIDKHYFENLQVEWNRHHPIDQSAFYKYI